MSKSISTQENFLLYFFLILFSFFALYYSNTFIIKDSLFHNSLSEIIETDRIDQIFEMRHKSIWISYAFIPIFLLIKLAFVFICVFAQLFLKNITIRYKKLINILLIAEFVFILQGFYKIFFFEYIDRPERIDDLGNVMQFSLFDLLNSLSISKYLYYPLQLINLFEVAYVIAIAHFVSKEIQQPFKTSLKYIAIGYGSGLFLWGVIVIFIQILLN